MVAQQLFGRFVAWGGGRRGRGGGAGGRGQGGDEEEGQEEGGKGGKKAMEGMEGKGRRTEEREGDPTLRVGLGLASSSHLLP